MAIVNNSRTLFCLSFFALCLAILSASSLSKGLQRCWHYMRTSDDPDSAGIYSGCSTWLSEGCLREAAVARFVREQIDHATRLVALVENTGVPARATLGKDIIYSMWFPEWPDEDLVPLLHPLDKQWRKELFTVRMALDELHIAAKSKLVSLRRLFDDALVELERNSALREISGSSAYPMLRRVQARMAANLDLSPLSWHLYLRIQRRLNDLHDDINPVVAHASAASAAYIKLLATAEPVIVRTENKLREIPRIWRWAFYVVNARQVRTLGSLLPELKHACNSVRSKGEIVDIVHDNVVQLRDYLLWYNDSMTHQHIVDSYKPHGLGTADDEIGALQMELASYLARTTALHDAIFARQLYYPPRRTFVGHSGLPPGA